MQEICQNQSLKMEGQLSLALPETPGKKGLPNTNNFYFGLGTPPLISRNSEDANIQMQLPWIKLDMDSHITRLIDEVCASDIASPDISAFDIFDKEGAHANRCEWLKQPFSSCTELPHHEDKFPPSSPIFVFDDGQPNEDFLVQSNKMTGESINDVSNYGYSDDCQTELKESVNDLNYERSMEFSQEHSWFLAPHNLTLSNWTQMSSAKIESPQSYALQDDDQIKLNEINSTLALDSPCNILTEAASKTLLEEEEGKLTSKEIEEKVESFLNDGDDIPRESEKRSKVILSDDSILMLFRESPQGKLHSGNLKLVPLKIMVQPNIKIHNSSISTIETPRDKIKFLIPAKTTLGPETKITRPEKTETTGEPELDATDGALKSRCRMRMKQKRNLFEEEDLWDESQGMQRKRNRLSLYGLSEAEKYKRIREQNNIASKKCREKRKGDEGRMHNELQELTEKNRDLKLEQTQLTANVTRLKILWKALISSG